MRVDGVFSLDLYIKAGGQISIVVIGKSIGKGRSRLLVILLSEWPSRTE